MRIPLNDDFHFWTASEFLCRDFTIEKEEDVTGGGLLPRRAKAIIGCVSKIGKSLFGNYHQIIFEIESEEKA